MRLFLAVAFFLSVAPCQAAEKPIELAKEDVAILSRANPEKIAEVCKKYDGKIIKITGRPERFDSLWIAIQRPPGSRDDVVKIRIEPVAHKAVKDLLASATRQNSLVVIYGRAEFSRELERPTKDYVIPVELRPKNGSGELTGDAINENSDRIKKIMQDARKKGKIEKYTAYNLFALKEVVTDMKYFPKPK